MITQKVPQSFKEAIDSIEEELKACGDTETNEVVICHYIDMKYSF